MPCTDCDNDQARTLEAEALERLAATVAGYLALPFAELAAVLAPAANVRAVAASRFHVETIALGLEPLRIAGASPDRRSITITNTSTVAGGTTQVIRVGGSDALQDLSGSFPLADGAALTIDAQADVFVRATGAGGFVSILSEQYDA